MNEWQKLSSEEKELYLNPKKSVPDHQIYQKIATKSADKFREIFKKKHLNLSYGHRPNQKLDIFKILENEKKQNPRQDISNIITEILPNRLALMICKENNISGNISELSNKSLKQLSESINAWVINPTGSEGYKTAEVTLGGVDTNEISSKTMMSLKNPGLFFIGEVVDVTGHLGGYNFQWAWSSGFVAGQYA